MATTTMAAMEPPRNDHCDKLRNLNVLNLIVSIVILVGMLVSYLPQHYRIIHRRTSEGISPYFVLLGTTSATAAFANILLLPESRADVACCRDLDSFHCLAGLLGIAQLGVQWISFTFIFVLFLVFFRYSAAATSSDADDGDDGDDSARWQTAILVGSLTLFHGLAVIVISGIIGAGAPRFLGAWAAALGLTAALLAGVQYVPQIWTTYRLKHVGSLSIAMMCMQTPGGYLFATSLFLRLGWAGWSSWGIFLLTATMQGLLLYLAIYYEIQARNRGTPEAPLQAHRPSHSHLQPNGFDDDVPGPYTAHPEQYADTPEDLSALYDRQEGAAADDTTPLLRPGGIGTPQKNYAVHDGRRRRPTRD